MYSLGRILILLGLILLAAGGVVLLMGRMHIPLGRLPGDMTLRGRNWTFSFPLMTSIVLSVVLSLILWAFRHIGR